jgi:GTPase
MGIVNEEDFQIVYSDTPGILDPKYKLQEGMMRFVYTALQDADVLLWVTEVNENKAKHTDLIERLSKLDIPIFILVNKIDESDQANMEKKLLYWQKVLPNAKVAPISALHKFNTDKLLDAVVKALPEGPPYFPKDELTDKPMRFFMAEIIREKILMHYKQEIPYSCEVIIEEYKVSPDLVRIRAVIMVARDSQKGILIGHQGNMLKRVGTEARIDMEAFIANKVFLQMFVKVDKNWRDDERKLKRYGYFD